MRWARRLIVVTGLALASGSAANAQGAFDLDHEGDMGGLALRGVSEADQRY